MLKGPFPPRYLSSRPSHLSLPCGNLEVLQRPQILDCWDFVARCLGTHDKKWNGGTATRKEHATIETMSQQIPQIYCDYALCIHPTPIIFVFRSGWPPFTFSTIHWASSTLAAALYSQSDAKKVENRKSMTWCKRYIEHDPSSWMSPYSSICSNFSLCCRVTVCMMTKAAAALFPAATGNTVTCFTEPYWLKISWTQGVAESNTHSNSIIYLLFSYIVWHKHTNMILHIMWYHAMKHDKMKYCIMKYDVRWTYANNVIDLYIYII